jgi:hypothetical protein
VRGHASKNRFAGHPTRGNRAEIVGDERSLAVEQLADLIGLIIEALGVQSEQPPREAMR